MQSPARPYGVWPFSRRGAPFLGVWAYDSRSRDLAVERRYTYTYRLTFWHIINTFLLLAGGNLWKNQIQHSQNTLVFHFKEQSS